jgi:hypothetical protein
VNEPPHINAHNIIENENGGGHQPLCCAAEMSGTPFVITAICDEIGDEVTHELEVVLDGAPFTGVATHRLVISYEGLRTHAGDDPGEACQTIPLPLTGLVAPNTYAIQQRLLDLEGPWSYGWVNGGTVKILP